MKPGAFEYEKYHRKCEEINREAGGFENGDLITLVALIMAVGGPILAYEITKNTFLDFAFKRPNMFRLKVDKPANQETASAAQSA